MYFIEIKLGRVSSTTFNFYIQNSFFYSPWINCSSGSFLNRAPEMFCKKYQFYKKF